MRKAEPMRDANGLPICTTDDCASFDGKRCELMGFRPATHCEPQLVEDYAELTTLRAKLRAGEGAGG